MNTATECDVSGAYLRGFLAGLRKVSGAQYPVLLEKAGLGQFIQKYPVADQSAVAEGQQVISLFLQVHILLGTDTYNLFMKNLAREFARVAATLPLAVSISNGVYKHSSAFEFKEWLIRLTHISEQAISQKIVITETSKLNELEIVHLDCIYCAEQNDLNRVGCSFVSTFYKEVIFELTGNRCAINETLCGATDESRNCHFLLHRF